MNRQGEPTSESAARDRASDVPVEGDSEDLAKSGRVDGDRSADQERYELALAAAQVGVWDWDLATGEIYLDPRLKALLGFEDAEIRNHADDWGRRFHPDDLGLLMKAVQGHLNEGAPYFKVEHRMLHKDGSIRWFSGSGSVVRDERGEPIRMLGTDTDITERKRSEEAVVRAKREWERTFDALPDLIAITDANYRILQANKAMTDRLGIRPEEAAGLTCYECVHDSEAPPAFCPHSQTLADGQEHTAEAYEERLGGEFLITASPLHDHEGRLVGSVHVARDITQRKRAERALQQAHDELEARVAQRTAELRTINESLEREISDRQRAEEAYRALVDHSLQGLIIAQDMRFAFVNQAFADMSGYTVGELQGMSAEETLATVHPDDRALIRKRHEERIQGKPAPERHEYRGIRKDGSLFWVEMHASLIEYRGRPAIQAAVVDITDRRRAEEALRESKEKYEGLYNNAQAGLARCRISDGKLLEANHRLAEMFGYDDVEAFIAEFDVEKHYADRATRRRLVAELRERGEFRDIEARCSRRDGAKFWIRCSGRRPPGKDYIEGNAIDVTEQKQAEQRVRLLSSVVEQSRVGMAVSDMDGDLIDVNDAFADMHGYTPDEMIGENLSVFHTPDQTPSVIAANRQVHETGEFSGEIWHTRRDGTAFPTLMHNSLLRDEAGDAIGMISTLRDIAERKRAEEALRESEERFRTFLEDLSDAAYTADARGNITFLNKYSEGLTGLPVEDVVHKPFLPLFTEESQRVAVDVYQRTLNGESPEFELTFNTGRVCQFRQKPLRDYDGNIIGVSGISRDVTERKRAEEALRKERDFSTSLVQASPTFFVAISAEGKTLMMNEAMLAGLGYRADEVVGTDYLETFVPTSDRAILGGVFDQLVTSNELTQNENRVLTKDGREVLVEWHGRPVLKENGEFDYFFGVGIDITKRKAAEEALRRSEQYFRALIDNASDLITILSEDGTMQYQSPSFERVLGYDQDRLIGKNAFELIHPEDADRVRETFVRGSRIPGHVESTEFRFRHANGSWRVLEATGTNLLYEPAVRGVVINVRDITDRKEAEAASLVFGRSIEQSTDAIFTLNADRRITFANNAAEKLYGYSAEEMIGHRPRDLLRIDSAIVKEAWDALARHRRWSAVHDAYDKEGNRISVDVNLMQISDEQGKLVAAVSLSRDARGSRRLEAIQQVAEAAAGTDAADDEAIQRIMSHLPELVGLDQWAIYLHDPDKDMLALRFCSETGREVAQAIPRIPMSAPLSGQVFGSGEIVFSHDVASDDRFTQNATFRKAMSTPTGQALRATCILPLRSGGRILGTLYLSDNRVRTFTPEELSITKTLASQVGLFLSRHAPGLGAQEQPPVRTRPADSVSVVADSETMQLVLRSAQRVAHTEMPAVILGPTGAGKGHLAKYIHSISPRANGPFMTVNCACLDGELILSELFGHERGAFTGAVRQQKGCFELANGGTLLLDEVVELPLSAQAKLLQLVETQQFRRLGGQRTITTDVRIICTTNADIRECVRTGKMREDLYYRLNAGEIVIPPLGERPEDIRSLAMAYLRTQSLTTGEPARTITDGALARLREYPWPGNVRELQNVLALAMSHGGQVIGASDLRFVPAVAQPAGPVRLGGEKSDRETILTALRHNRWNRTLTADELGIHRNTLRNRMRKYGIFE